MCTGNCYRCKKREIQLDPKSLYIYIKKLYKSKVTQKEKEMEREDRVSSTFRL
jgi:hypothetical protein